MSILVGVGVVALIVLNLTTDIFKKPAVIERYVPTNEVLIGQDIPTTPPVFDGTGGPTDPQVLELAKNYTPSRDVFSNFSIYEKESVDLALWGEFDTAELDVEGEITDDQLHFLTVNVGTVSGALGVDRIAQGRLAYKDGSGAFSKKNPLDITIDLRAPAKLSTSDQERQQGLGTSKLVTLWDYIVPPPSAKDGTKVKVLLAPYSQAGVYGEGAIITKLAFVYRCKDDNKDLCRAEICPKDSANKPGSACVKNKFGAGSETKYIQYQRKR